MRLLVKVPIVVVLLFLAAMALTIYLMTQTSLLPSIARRLLVTYVETKYDVNISFTTISGSLLQEMVVEDIRVDLEAQSHRYRLLKVQRLAAYYDLRRLLNGDWHLDSLILTRPTVVLRADSAGKPLLPKLTGGGNGAGQQLDFEVDVVRLNDGRFQWFRLPEAHYIDSVNLLLSVRFQDGKLQVFIDSLSCSYPQRDCQLQQLQAGLTLAADRIDIDSLHVKTTSSTIRGEGYIPRKGDTLFQFRFDDSHLSLDEMARLTGISLSGEADFSAIVSGDRKSISGRADIDGILFGRHLGPLVTDFHYADGVLALANLFGRAFDGHVAGDIQFDLIARPEIFTADLEIENINIDRIVPNTYSSRLSGDVRISGAGLGANSFNLDLELSCHSGGFDFVNFDSLFGMLSLNTTDIYFHSGFTLFYKNSRFTTEGVVNYIGDMFLTGSFQTSQLADFWGDLFIKELSGGARGDFIVYGSDFDPDISGTFFGDSCSFYGFSTDSLHARFDIARFLTGRRGHVAVHTWVSDVWNLPADSVFCNLEIDSSRVDITSAKLYDDRTYFAAAGLATIYDSTAVVKISDFQFSFDSLKYVNVEPVEVGFLPSGILVQEMTLASKEGSITISCDYGYDSTIHLEVELDSFPIAPWLLVLEADTMLSGSLNLSGELSGLLGNPAISVAGAISDFHYGDTRIGTIAGRISYIDSTLQVDDLTLNGSFGSANLTGHLPLLMDLDSGIVRMSEEQMSFHLQSVGDDLSLLRLFLEDLESLTGDYDLKLDIYGTPKQPESKGSFTLANGTAKLYQVENPIENIKAEITSAGRTVEVDWVEGVARYKGKKGKIVATGEINILSRSLIDYDIELRGIKVPIKYDLGDIYVYCDFDVLQITGSHPPLVCGDVIVRDATYYDEFAEEEIIEAREAADTVSTIDYIINIEFLPASVKVRNSDVNAVLDGKLTIVREQARDNYIGVLNVVRGKYYLLGTAFKLKEGSQIIFDDIERPNPALAIEVSTRVRDRSVGGVGSGYTRLDLIIGGTLMQPSINAAAGSSYTDEDIVGMLLLNSPASASRQEVMEASPLEERILDVLGVSLSRQITRFIGVEQFEIIPAYGQDQQLSGAEISLGFYTAPNLYTYLSSPLSFIGQTEVGFEYRFGRHFFLGGNRDRDNLYHLNLNLNWEIE